MKKGTWGQIMLILAIVVFILIILLALKGGLNIVTK